MSRPQRTIQTHADDERIPEGWQLKRLPDRDFGQAWWAIRPATSYQSATGYGPYLRRPQALRQAQAGAR